MEIPHAGEVEITVNGMVCTLKLTLGALAGLEEALEENSLMALVQRFEQGRFSARDVLALLAAGMKGGGSAMGAGELAEATIAGGPAAAARAAAQLLARAFALPEET